MVEHKNMSESNEKTIILYIAGKQEDDNIYVNAVSLLALFTLECCQSTHIQLVFIENKNINESLNNNSYNFLLFKLTSSCFKSKYNIISFNDCPKMIRNCELPVIYDEVQNYCTVGLCSSLRCILSTSDKSSLCDLNNRLLGFRNGCLQACAEVSIWTKFCEVESVEMLKSFYSSSGHSGSILSPEIPTNILRFERHLEHPPILHNALKQKQESLQRTSSYAQFLEIKKKKLSELPNLEHKFAEGVEMTLADILLYATFTLVLHKLFNRKDLHILCPLLFKWHSLMSNNQCIINGQSLLKCVMKETSPIPSNIVSSFIVPSVANESLYNSDPLRYKPRWRSFTHQDDIDAVSNKLTELKFISNTISYKKNCLCEHYNQVQGALEKMSICSSSSLNVTIFNLYFETPLDWESYPLSVHPSDGQLPASRLKRKLEQLESIAQIVLEMARDGNVIVDFCSGGGHLGILLAYCLPKCKLLFVENKKESLDKAQKRVKALNLTNVEFYQCNLDYFSASFDIGICLHACGVAADLVMQKCIIQKSSFVCSPCCYGSVRPNHILSYPRSLLFSETFDIKLPEYLILAHAADQTHTSDNPKTIQGVKCMQLVDYDRLSYAKSFGYEIALTVMNPPECSPKNHILIGTIKKEV